MDSIAGRPQSHSPSKRRIPGARRFAWMFGLVFSLAASFVAVVLAVAMAASVLVLAVMGGAVLALASFASRARRTVKVSGEPAHPIIEARHVGGHSWVAYGWDRQG
jgi:Flp pilus assembly protein TadB